MKKIIILTFAFIIFLTGCNNKNNQKGVINCNRTATISEGIKTNLNYKITYSGKYVDMIESDEVLDVSNADTLKVYKQTIENMYKAYDELDYYDVDIKVDGNKLISKTKIDYTKIDTDKMIQIDSSNKQIIKDGKVLVDDVKNMYSQLGVTCE